MHYFGYPILSSCVLPNHERGEIVPIFIYYVCFELRKGKLEGIINPPSNKAKNLALETYKFMLQGIYVMPILTLFIGV